MERNPEDISGFTDLSVINILSLRYEDQFEKLRVSKRHVQDPSGLKLSRRVQGRGSSTMESLRSRSHVRSMIDPDGAVLLDLERGKYFSLNAVGAEIWKKVEAGAERSEILDHLQSTFQVPLNLLQQDLDNFVEMLRGKGLIHAGS